MKVFISSCAQLCAIVFALFGLLQWGINDHLTAPQALFTYWPYWSAVAACAVLALIVEAWRNP